MENKQQLTKESKLDPHPQLSLIEALPSELLVNIFSYLNSVNYRNIAMTCKRFNAVINNSPKLTGKFRVKFNGYKMGNEWIGSRRYTNVYFDGSTAMFFLDIFLEIGENVTELYMNGLGIQMMVLKAVLGLMPNVTTLSLGCDRNEVESKPADFTPILARTFKSFEFSGTNENFQIFVNCQTEDFKLTQDFRVESTDNDAFKHFIKNQTHLVSLRLSNFKVESSMFTDRTLNEVQFKLKTLRFYGFKAYKLPNFKLFIDNFKYSLTFVELEFSDSAVLEKLYDFPNLKTVSLKKIFFLEPFEPMKHVEELIVENVKVSLAESFPNIKRMTIIDYLKNPSQVKNLKQLEYLKVGSIYAPDLRVPSVRQLLFYGTRFKYRYPFKFEGSRVEELTINYCLDINWLEEYLDRDATRLKLLKIKDIILSEEIHRAIERNREKIERVIVKSDLELQRFTVRGHKCLESK